MQSDSRIGFSTQGDNGKAEDTADCTAKALGGFPASG